MPYLQYQPNINISLNDVLKLMPQLEAKELELFLNEAAAILADLKTPKVDKEEVELLLKINNWIAPQTEQRYEELRAKMKDDQITKSEYEELLKLVDIVELHNADRISNLFNLSKIRNISLDELMKDLGIMPTAYA